MGTNWRVYGVSERGNHNQAGVKDLPTTKEWGCGVCGTTFGLTIYPDINSFYQGHVAKCGVPEIILDLDYTWC